MSVAVSSVVLVDRLFTFVYFIPTMIVLMTGSTLVPEQAVETALLWARLAWIRQTLTLAALLLAMRALPVFAAGREAAAPGAPIGVGIHNG